MQPKQILSLFVLTLGVTTSDANVIPFGRSINPQDAAGKHLEGRRFTNSSGVEARAVNITVDDGPEKMRLTREALGKQLGLNEKNADNSDGKEAVVASTSAAAKPASVAGSSAAISNTAVKTSVVTVPAAGATSAAASTPEAVHTVSTAPLESAPSGSVTSLTVAPSLGLSFTLNSIPLGGAPSSVASQRGEAAPSKTPGSVIATGPSVPSPVSSISARDLEPTPPPRESSSESSGQVRPTLTSLVGVPEGQSPGSGPGTSEQHSTTYRFDGFPGGPEQHASTTSGALEFPGFSHPTEHSSSSAEYSSGFATSRRPSPTPSAEASTSPASPRPSASTVSGRPGAGPTTATPSRSLPSPSPPSLSGFLSEAEQAVCEFAKSLGIVIPGYYC